MAVSLPGAWREPPPRGPARPAAHDRLAPRALSPALTGRPCCPTPGRGPHRLLHSSRSRGRLAPGGRAGRALSSPSPPGPLAFGQRLRCPRPGPSAMSLGFSKISINYSLPCPPKDTSFWPSGRGARWGVRGRVSPGVPRSHRAHARGGAVGGRLSRGQAGGPAVSRSRPYGRAAAGSRVGHPGHPGRWELQVVGSTWQTAPGPARCTLPRSAESPSR